MLHLFGQRLGVFLGDATLLARAWPWVYIYLDARDTSLTPSILRRGTWERRISLTLMRFLRRGGTFVDIGANCGYHALAAARRVGKQGVVIAIEPQERLCALILRSIEANRFLKQMKVMRLAIGAREETATLRKLTWMSGSASLHFGDDVPDQEQVPVVPLPLALERAAEQFGRPIEPDVIKVDVEGHEYDLWDGMKEWTRTRPHLVIVIEYSPYGYRNLGRDPLALLDEFRDYGFAIHQQGLFWPKRVNRAALERMAAGDQQFDLVLIK